MQLRTIELTSENNQGSGSHLEADLTILPSPVDATEFPWGTAIGSRKGLHGFNSLDARSRSFNLIRAKLWALGRERDWRMLGVVSATPNVGKSFIAANLAASMSRDPRIQAYLVDLDLRRSAIKDVFGIETQEGLSDFLAAPDMSSRLPTFRPHDQKLIIVPNVAGENLSAEHLAAKRARLLRAMRASDQPNYFIFDLPPVFANDDAITTMDLLDAYVLIAEEGRTTQGEIESAVEMLGDERLAGVVLNKYRGGLISDGRGLEDRYAKGYYAGEGDDEPA